MPTTVAEKTHAKYAASSSERWLACAGSIALSERAPAQKESSYASEGTQAHACLEMFLKNPKAAAKETYHVLLKNNPKEMVEYCFNAAVEIWGRVTKGATLLAETKTDLSWVHQSEPDSGGTMDAVVIEQFGRLTVADFKYGAGIPVSPERNPQLIMYALGIAHQYDYNFAEICLVVIQPRAEYHDGSTVREWIISVEELRTWEEVFATGIEKCEDPLADFNAGDHCRFCPAAVICPEIADRAFKQAQVDFEPIGNPRTDLVVLPKITLVQPQALGHMLTNCDLIEKWIDAVRKYACHVLETGTKIPGFKLVPKRAQRKWVENIELAARARYGEQVFTKPELLSPAQFEKKFKCKEWVDMHTTKESSGTTLAPESDSRPAVDQIEQDFTESEPETNSVPVKKALPEKKKRAKTIPKKPNKSKKPSSTKVKAKASKAKARNKSRKR